MAPGTASEAPQAAREGPLQGIRVLEFSLVFSASYAGVQLSDLGAGVIKVEPPGGEPFRNLGTPVPGYGKNFQWANRGKQSLVIDLKRDGALTPANRDAIRSVLGIEDDPSDDPGFDGEADIAALREAGIID
jgi:hypothetical protein